MYRVGCKSDRREIKKVGTTKKRKSQRDYLLKIKKQSFKRCARILLSSQQHCGVVMAEPGTIPTGSVSLAGMSSHLH